MTTLSSQENEKITPQSLINIRPVVTVIREFSAPRSSQFMDQANPLSEKRQAPALGARPGRLRAARLI